MLVELYNAPEQNRYCQKINRVVNASANHIREIVQLLEQHRFVEINPTRQIKKIRVTEKGERVALSILKIKSELKCQ